MVRHDPEKTTDPDIEYRQGAQDRHRLGGAAD